MKKYVYLLFICFYSTLSISQALLVTGDTVVYGSIDDFGIESHVIVKNIGSTTINVLCEKNVISEPSTGSNDFCWGGTCYGAGTMISTKLDTLDPGEQTNGFTGYFHPFIPGPATPGVAVVEYCFYPQSDPTDQTCITVTYNAVAASSDNCLDIEKQIGVFYPNPARDYTSLEYSIEESSTLEVSNILGDIVKIIELYPNSGEKIYIGDLKKGIYFGRLVSDGESIRTKKLIINK